MSKKRSQARHRAVQAIYQWQLTGQDLGDIENQFLADPERAMSQADLPYFRELLHQVAAHLRELDGQIEPFLDRPLEQIDPVERAILRIGAYELSHRVDIPYRVVINEAVEAAKVFGAEQGHKYVNSILDKAARKLRPDEKRRF